jgi:alpha-L-fucosidase
MNRKHLSKLLWSLSFIIFIPILIGFPLSVMGQQTHNKSNRLEWFSKLGYGLFIHWSIDSQIGTVISHSLVGASKEYTDKFFNELPKTFNPEKFDPNAWARLAKVAGVKYVVFTAKHHSGFCMFDTQTTDFNIMHTPYAKDITKELINAFRKQGIAIGLYYSPDDFHFLYTHDTLISRRSNVLPENNPALKTYDKRQLRELLTNYGTIDILFIDGPDKSLCETAWKINPNIVITRGAMKTPEISASNSQGLPQSQLPDIWEANYTMGTAWQYKPTHEHYHSGTYLIKKLIQIRAENGNMLLDIGPKPDGAIAQKQKDILREIGTWLFINGKAIYDTKPWIVTNQDSIWFTASKNQNVLYAIITSANWKWGTQKTIILKSIHATKKTKISILGQNSKVLEYHPDIIPKTRWKNTASGLKITAYRAQRIYNNWKWPNPVVIKITNPKSMMP